MSTIDTADPLGVTLRRARVAVRMRATQSEADAWPHTTRLLPWMLAAFLVMLWLVPIQDVELPINLPVDAKLDRFVVALLVFVWVPALLAGGTAAPQLRRSPIALGVIGFLALAVASVLLNLQVLLTVDDFGLAVKKLALLGAYVAFFFVAVSTVRPKEVRPFCLLIIVLACFTALGGIWEYRTGHNYFYDITGRLLPPGFTLGAEAGDSRFDRPSITGPAQHSLALTTMLAFAVPFAVVGVARGNVLWRRIAYAVATALIMGGAVATLRKTSLVVPVSAVLLLVLYWPRRMLRLAPLGLLLVIVIQAMSPGALASIRYQLLGGKASNSISTQGRTADYDAVAPDIKTHLATGRGYGTYDARKYRLLDNQYLLLLIETGVLGLAAFLAMVLAVIRVAHPVIRAGDPRRAPPALACAAVAFAFLVCTMLFDVLSFPQVPYLFFFIAALAAVTAVGRPQDAAAAR